MDDNKYNEPILGRGRYRSEGQKIGEMELILAPMCSDVHRKCS